MFQFYLNIFITLHQPEFKSLKAGTVTCIFTQLYSSSFLLKNYLNNVSYIYTCKNACKVFGVVTSTLRRWDKQNKIKTIRTPSNYRRYDISSVNQIKNKNSIVVSKKKICYCRVSSKKQMDDIGRQKDYLKSKYPNHEIISDIGSGIN